MSGRGSEDDPFGILEMMAEDLCKDLHPSIREEQCDVIRQRVAHALGVSLLDIVHCYKCQQQVAKKIADEVAPNCPVCHRRNFALVSVEELRRYESASGFFEPAVWFWNEDKARADTLRESVLTAVRNSIGDAGGICIYCIDKPFKNALSELAPKCTICGKGVKYFGASCAICGAKSIHGFLAKSGCSRLMRDSNKPKSDEDNVLIVCARCFRGAKEAKKLLVFSFEPPRWEIGGSVLEYIPVKDDDFIGVVGIGEE
jgi:hypothetical protein